MRGRLAGHSAVAAVALAAATAVAAASAGSASAATATAPLPHTPVGRELAWVIGEVNGGSRSLAAGEVGHHVTPGFLAGLPARQFVEVARQATSAYAPVRFTGFAGRPSPTSAIALIETRTHEKLAIYASLDRRPPHRIAALEVGAPPPAGASTTATAGRYTGAFEIGGGRKLFLTCSGSGTPTVILEAGANGGAHSWFAVQPWLATTTRVCSYDRANVPGGSSDPAPKPQTAADVVSDLHSLLAAARVPGPYVLAGHSNGGLFARLYATTYPEQVRGLVLIDTGNYPGMLDRLYRKLMSPPQWRAYRTSLRARPPFAENAGDEQVDLATSYAQLAAAQRRHPLPPLPLVVISHGIPEPPMGREVVRGIDKAIEPAWQRMQIELARVVPGGTRIVAAKSGHMIPTEQPALVVRTIRGVLTRLDTSFSRPRARLQAAADAQVASR
jgi:pimeloyl-ACP methyl ester carboxylesterase